MTPCLLISTKHKNTLFKVKTKKPSRDNCDKYINYKRLFNKVFMKAEKIYYDNVFNEHKRNCRMTWKIINKTIGRQNNKHNNFPNYFNDNNTTVTGDKQIAKGFNKFFTSIGPELANKIPPSKYHYTDFLGSANQNNFNFKQHEILQYISKLKSKTSYGLDLLSNKVLKSIAPLIIKPLTHIINLSFSLGIVPSHIKISKVIPVYKSDSKNSFTNYRPISILSSFAKLIE